jgi:hypothetical protein
MDVRRAEPLRKLMGRSGVSNGKRTFLDREVDGRSVWARRFRDLIGAHVADLGGDTETSTAEMHIVRRASALCVELEIIEQRFSQSPNGGTPADLLIYSTLSNTLRRLLESVGLKRRPREIDGVTLDDVIAELDFEKTAAANGGAAG